MTGREITIDKTGISEITYKRGDPDDYHGYALVELALRRHPAVDFSAWEMVGFTKADGISTFVDTIGVVIKGQPPQSLLNKYPVHPNSEFADYFQLKVGTDGSEPVVKFYDLTLGLYPLPSFPQGTSILANQGIGVYFGDRRRHLHDVYFTHTNFYKVSEWAESQKIEFPFYGDEKTPGITLGFGATWDERDFKIVKLKRYFFPNDPLLKDPFSK
jgi:hypothetical protein